MARFKYSVGPWNVHEGADAFGPEVRGSIAVEKKLERFKEIGFTGIQFHDDDAVPDMNQLSDVQIKQRARELKGYLDGLGLAAEFVAPRLWMDERTIDGAFTSNSKEDREFALWRCYRSVDIARELGTNYVVLWLAREGTLCYESKDAVAGIRAIRNSIDAILAYDPAIRIMIEPKPNEPIDRSYIPTTGHVLGLGAATRDPSRVGALLESAHAVLAGLDPAYELAYCLAHDKLWGVHLNDQNGMKYDQDKAFGVENLRAAFNQVKILKDYNFGQNGEYVGLDVKAMRTQSLEGSFQHLENSLRIVQLLEEKVARFDHAFQQKCQQERNYEALEMYVLELLLGHK